VRKRWKFLLSTVVAWRVVAAMAAEPVELTEKAYAAEGQRRGTIVLQVNWGRVWHCGKYENAQLQQLSFSRLPLDPADRGSNDVRLTGSKLTAPNAYRPYALLIEPGEYALSEFDVKVAASVTEIGHAHGDRSTLIKDGKAMGGSFSVAPGEIVYIGHFGVDCGGEPMLWRTYVEGRGEFDRYVLGFHKRFPFTKDTPVVFRLFATDVFGKPYDLTDVPAAPTGK
jgi:hypothetical protein